MNNFKQFFYNDTEFQVSFDAAKNPWWIASQICSILNIKDTNVAMRRLDEEEKLIGTIYLSGQNRAVTFINESGLYSLIMTSRVPSAKRFKRWVTKIVLPQIRKTGSYGIKELTIEQRLEIVSRDSLKVLEINRQQAERIQEMEPKALFHDTVVASNEWMPLFKFGKISEIGARKIFDILFEKGFLFWLDKQRIPYLRCSDLLILKKYNYKKNGVNMTSEKVYISAKGQAYFTNLLIPSGQLMIEGK